MLREFAITIYLAFFRIIFNLMNRFALKKKTSFVASFGDNVESMINELNTLNIRDEIVILKTKNCNIDFSPFDVTVLSFHPLHVVSYIKGIYHLATSRYIFIDNYFGFLAALVFRPEVKCIQLWHASGALKQFGLEDKTNQYRTEKALSRFRAVYSRFDYVVVGSKKMEEVFHNSFGLPSERFLPTGIPRTDFFFNQDKMDAAKEKVMRDFPMTQNKQVILYAPTYRDHELDEAHIALDIQAMYEALKDDYFLFVRLHPAISKQFTHHYPDFVYDVSTYPDLQDLLIYADLLISDYSSIPFDFALLEKPMIFYAYDLDKYKNERGLIPSYERIVPGPVLTRTSELVEHILDKQFTMEKVKQFKEQWTNYSHGNASNQLIRQLYLEDRAFAQLEETVKL